MSNWSSDKKMKLLFENFRGFVNEQEEDAPSPTGQTDQQIAAKVVQAYKGGPGAVRAFMDSPEGQDPKVRQFLHKAQAQFDGSGSDDNISISRANPTLSDLVPTQRYIDLMQSVSFPLGSAKALKKAIASKKGFGPISISDNFILDGHHRWSGQYAITPDGTILATNIGLPGDPQQKLASAQLAIAAVDPNIKDPHPSKGGGAKTNILGKGADEIYQKIMDNVNQQTDKNADGPLLNDAMVSEIAQSQDSVILQWAGLEPGQGADAQQVREAIAKRTAQNLAALPPFAKGAPDRPDMPQFDHDSIGGGKGYQKIKSRLATGDLNVVPPFIKEGDQELSESKTYDRWKKIIKG